MNNAKKQREATEKVKTTDIFKRIGNIKGTFHTKLGTIKDRKGKHVIEAEEIKKRQKEYTEELYREDLNDQDNHNGIVPHSESDILECEVKWALGSTAANKASGGDGIPAELLKILKADAIKVLYSICHHVWKTQQWPQNWKRSVLIPIPKQGSTKGCSNHQTIELISHASMTLLKILQTRLQH